MSAPRLGLRAQIIFALFAVFALSFALLGTATLRLTRAAADAERARTARVTAHALSAVLAETPDKPARALSMLESLGPRLDIAAVELRSGGAATARWGTPPDAAGLTIRATERDAVTVWLRPTSLGGHLPLANLVIFYVGVTGLAVMVLAYIALTLLVVRPLGDITHQSEQLAAGASVVHVPGHGAAEVVRLARALNDMAGQLRADREALEHRLRELEATTIDLRAAQRQLIHGEKLASVGRLAAGIAHEIGNPLAAIVGLAELLQKGVVEPGEQQEFLARIQRETERINGIIGDLLAFSRREPEETGVQSADLRQAVDDAVNLVRPQKDSRRVDLRVELDPGLSRVAAPQHRLTQVLLNLLLNALDALQGEGTIVIDARRLDEDGRARCLLAVDDDGPGIADAVLDNLFEPFTTTKPVGQGTGLGLAVCHALIEAAGGTIEAHNRPSGGARFEIRLDCVPARGDGSPPA